MNQIEHAKLQGKLEGLREAYPFIGSSSSINFILNKITTLESQLRGITVHDEVAELKALLAKAIVPKFEVGQEGWLFNERCTRPILITISKIISYGNNELYYGVAYPYDDESYDDNELFTTEAEALKSLEEE